MTQQGFDRDLFLEESGDGGEKGDRQSRRLFLGQLKEFLDSGEGAEVGGGKGDTGVICCSSQSSTTKDYWKLCLFPLNV